MSRRRIASDQHAKFLAGKRVLIVDDDADARDLLRAILEPYELEVCDSENAAGALAALEHTPFDLLISDIGMPECDGYSLIRAVRGGHGAAKIPAMALTAFVRGEDRARALLAGFDLHMGKPFDSDALIQAAAALIGAARAPSNRA